MKRLRRSPSTESHATQSLPLSSTSHAEPEHKSMERNSNIRHKNNENIDNVDSEEEDCFIIHTVYAQRTHLEEHLQTLLQERKNAIRYEDALRHKRRRAQLRKSTKQEMKKSNKEQSEEEQQQQLEKEQHENQEQVESQERSQSLSDVMIASTNSSVNENNSCCGTENEELKKRLSVKEYTREIRKVRKAISKLDEENGNIEKCLSVCSSKHMSNKDKGCIGHTESWKSYALPPLPVLLLPSARTGLTRVCANHVYKTVTFVGEKLCGVDGWCQVNTPLELHKELSSSQIEYVDEVRKLKTQKEKELEWAASEYATMQRFLAKHPDKTITDYFALTPSQMTALHEE